jgi:hypothetical protein
MEHEDKLPEMSFCGKCGKKLIANATFCAHCGAQIPKIGGISVDYQVDYGHVPKIAPSEPPHRFIDHFKGAVLNPKIEFQKISRRPNFRHPLFLNLLISLFSIATFLLLIGKVNITYTSEFFDSLPFTIAPEDMDPAEFADIFSSFIPFILPFFFILNWLIYSAILWIINLILASDVPPSERKFKKMATIVGWAQFPIILLQLGLTVIVLVFISPGEIIYHSMFEIEILTTSTTNLPIGVIIILLDLLVYAWGVILVYYGMKPQISPRSNPITICLVYGIVILFLPDMTDYVLELILSFF